ncbi:hypothetical protein WN51_10783 [Melipona quadrifasciata]|uniref:Uncharacterized protein n=1 Tax=Melipona quadrifasciata TaxID=166423 RepID=A0A0M9A4A2_9HYME|nr:hypothetical protein WN51_10783 [Melipona quadrifasciata]
MGRAKKSGGSGDRCNNGDISRKQAGGGGARGGNSGNGSCDAKRASFEEAKLPFRDRINQGIDAQVVPSDVEDKAKVGIGAIMASELMIRHLSEQDLWNCRFADRVHGAHPP